MSRDVSDSGTGPVVAICGKGGVGKTAITALLARALIDGGITPILLVDADPMMGLTSALRRSPTKTLAQVRKQVIERARRGASGEIADSVDYWMLEALDECSDHALLTMGRSTEPGCFCPINSLLRQALDLVREPYRVVLIDAEAGVEQVQREVTRRVTALLAVVDGSRRASETVEVLRDMVPDQPVLVVSNRDDRSQTDEIPEFFAQIPEDNLLRDFDRRGKSLWELPASSPSRRAAGILGVSLLRTLGLRSGL